VIERQVSEGRIDATAGRYTPVILGEAGDEPPLGVVTLKVLGVDLNPFSRILQPVPMMLA